jgi:aryl-alcohol dehydrogenase-like predicted oxidoreductase
METIKLHNLSHDVVRIGIGTWAIGGWMWGGTDESTSIDTIRKAFDKGLNLIDTAPVYGFGTSEKIVGKAIKKHGNREDIVLVTKVALEWKDDVPYRNSTKERIMKEIDDSLYRLQTDYIDVYMIHWPDPKVPFEKTAEAMQKLKDQGKIKSIAVSNYSPDQMDKFRKTAPIDVCEPPYNIFEREIENNVLPYCKKNDIKTLTYGALCRGLLSGKMDRKREFQGDDLRKMDPKFKPDRFEQYLNAANELNKFAQKNYNKNVRDLAVRWVLDKGADIALWGLRKPEQLEGIDHVFNWKIDEGGMKEIDNILDKNINNPVGPEFMAPPARS